MKVLFVFGTRPEAIKMAPIIAAMERRPEAFEARICVTAQHRDMLDSALGLFGLRPDHDLNLMLPNQTLSGLTARILSALDPVVEQERPDWILVQGDTTTAMAAGLVAYYHQVGVGHVEAGLRTQDKFQPFPEEINRRLASVVADLHFAPSERARDNLLREGVDAETVFVTGNTVIDALLHTSRLDHAPGQSPLLEVSPGQRVLLVTAHRRENFGRPLRYICWALEGIARIYRGSVQVVYPVHRNPNVWNPVHAALGNVPNISLLGPLDYRAFVHLMGLSTLVLTDSGGLQEEAPSLGKPVLVLRETTERVEAVEAGTARLVGTNTARIVAETVRLLDDPEAYARMASAINPYGDGHAAERICEALLAASEKRLARAC